MPQPFYSMCDAKFWSSFVHRTADGEPRLMTVINVYCPHVDPDNEDRLSYKLNFYRLLQARAEALLPHR